MQYTDVGKTWHTLSLIIGHARRDHDFQFTSIAHLLDVEYLRDCYESLNRSNVFLYASNGSSKQLLYL